jgi:hypothetical protein
MRFASSTWLSLSIVSIASLSACSGGGFDSPPAATADSALPEPGASWMLANAKDSALVYASGGQEVYVYSYPGGKLEGTLTPGGTVQGECVDKAGDIWMADDVRPDSKILEYAHGGTTPIATLSDGGDIPYGCSVDPNTGNLAVSNLADFAIFEHATGSPKLYIDPDLKYYYWAGYDGEGNLFAGGAERDGLVVLAELPKGGSTFINLSVDLGVPGSVEWDGKYITIGDQSYDTIWRLKVVSKRVTVVGETGLFGAGDPCYQFAYTNFGGANHRARNVVALDFGTEGTVAVWQYPTGGSPVKVYTGDFQPYGVAVSPARSSL